MKRLFVPIVALATVFVFTSCGGDDTVKPEITLPNGDLTIDLGDEAAALKGVTAKDNKDGDVTKDVKVAGLDFVGNGMLKYSVFDKANNEGTIERKVTIKADELFGSYGVSEYFIEGESTDNFNVTVIASGQDVTKLVVNNFMGLNRAATFVGNGKSMVLTMEKMIIDNGASFINGTVEYHKTTTGYAIFKATYSQTYANGDDSDNYTATFTIR